MLLIVLFVVIFYFLFCKSNETFDNSLKPFSIYSEAASTPSGYNHPIQYNAKECSNASTNQQILNYQLSLLNQTKAN